MKISEDAKKVAKGCSETMYSASKASTRLNAGTGGAGPVVFAIFVLCMLSKCSL